MFFSANYDYVCLLNYRNSLKMDRLAHFTFIWVQALVIQCGNFYMRKL